MFKTLEVRKLNAFSNICVRQVFDAFNVHEFKITVVFLAVSSLAAF